MPDSFPFLFQCAIIRGNVAYLVVLLVEIDELWM
jgi:hypothetical protein